MADNDLTSATGTKAEIEVSYFQSKWDAFYTHKSSCDLEILIFFRCSTWLSLA